MVVQCPTCQSKFRIADDKVTDRGVRVRCTSCRNVFQVRKPGAAAGDSAPGPGSTMDLSSLDAAAVSRPAARPGSRSAAAPATRSAPLARPAAARPPAAARSPNGTARRLDADDLFGMAELTGDAPLVAPSRPPPPPPAPKAAAKPMPNFDDIDIEVDDAPPPAPSRPPPPPRTRPPPPPKRATEPAPLDPGIEGTAHAAPPPPPADADGLPPDPTAAPPLHDPFEGMSFGESGSNAVELPAQPKKEKAPEIPRTEPVTPPPPPAPEIPVGRELVSSALTGLVGAALAIAVVIVAALSGDAPAGWLGFGPAEDIVATRVVSGLYDTAAGKPVFYVRGRVENRGEKVRGPVRVTAELVAEGSTQGHAEAIAGAEPTPEEVWSLRSASDVDKLNHSLEVTQAERKLEPGGSLPFFAVIADPPPDLHRHRLRVKVEPVDAWVPPRPRKGR